MFLRPAFSLCAIIQGDNLDSAVFTFAKREKVEEVCQRLGIKGADTSGKDDVFQTVAVFGMERDAGQIHHVQHIGISHFIADGEGDHIEILHRGLAFQCPQGEIVGAHCLLHITPGCEDTFTPDTVHLVHHTVQDAHAKVGHTNLVGVGEAECHTDTHVRKIFFDLIKFTAGIACRFLHSRQDSLYQFSHSFSSLGKSQLYCTQYSSSLQGVFIFG